MKKTAIALILLSMALGATAQKATADERRDDLYRRATDLYQKQKYAAAQQIYDQIAQGKPTVIHVSGGSGEHWIALIGYQNVDDPDCLTLANFVALDPWDGVQIVASDRYVLYGDGCEHISER